MTKLAWGVILPVISLGLIAGTAFLFARRATPMEPYIRFVDPDGQAAQNSDTSAAPRLATGSTSDLPTATILDETRYVFGALPRATLVLNEKATVGADGTVSFAPELPPVLRNAEHLLLVPEIKRGTTWAKLPNYEVTIDAAGPVRKVAIKLPVPDVAPDAPVAVYIEGFAFAHAHDSAKRTPEVRIPKDAYLEFALGVAEPAWEQGQVTFAVHACRAQDCTALFTETVDPATPAGRAWQERRVSLASLAGTNRSFRFTTRLTNSAPAAFSLALWGNPTVYAPRVHARDDVNIILLSIDTLRADHLPTYGYHHATAPFIDATFGTGGTVFERCVAPATTTGPSHMTMFTSVQPGVHGVGARSGLRPLSKQLLTLAEVLRGVGFETAAVTEDGWLSLGSGFGRGFDIYAENKSPNLWIPEGQIELTFARARRWLERNHDKRFFLFLHTYQVHGPYTPPKRYAGLFAEHDGVPVTDQSPGHLRSLVAYDEEIRYADDEVRSLFDSVKQWGLEQNTIFILMSDHGEEFLEHGRMEHGTQLYEEVTRVPLMFWGPSRIAAGRRVAELVGLVDLMPTVLQIQGLLTPLQATGASFADDLFGNPQRNPRPYFSEAWAPFARGPEGDKIKVLPPAYLLQVANEKLIRYRRDTGLEYEYYELAADPQERNNLFGDRSATLADRRTLLDEYENNCNQLAMANQPPAKHTKQTPSTVAPDPAQTEKLRALGYIQ